MANPFDDGFDDFINGVSGLSLSDKPVSTEIKAENPQEKNHEFAANHYGMMSGSSVGLIIIEPASDEEIKAAKIRLNNALHTLAAKGLAEIDSEGNITVTASYEQAVVRRAKTIYEECETASRVLERLQNNEFGETAKSYLDEIVSQRRRVFNPERPRAFKGNAATEWGNGKELEAIAAYEELTGLKLEKTGDKQEFVRLGYVESIDFDFSEWFGCTPDSITPEMEWDGEWSKADSNIVIPREFKNPSSGVVFDRYRKLKNPLDLKKENPLYYWQCIAQMAVLNAPYMQWIAYDCDVINPADRFVVIDFERDMEIEQVLIDSLYKAVRYIQDQLSA